MEDGYDTEVQVSFPEAIAGACDESVMVKKQPAHSQMQMRASFQRVPGKT